MLGAFHDLDCDIGGVFEIFGEPDGGEMPPPEFLDNDIAVEEDFSDVAGVIAA